VINLFIIPLFIIILSLGNSLTVAQFPESEWEQLYWLHDLAPGNGVWLKAHVSDSPAQISPCCCS